MSDFKLSKALKPADRTKLIFKQEKINITVIVDMIAETLKFLLLPIR